MAFLQGHPVVLIICKGRQSPHLGQGVDVERLADPVDIAGHLHTHYTITQPQSGKAVRLGKGAKCCQRLSVPYISLNINMPLPGHKIHIGLIKDHDNIFRQLLHE